MKVLGIDPGLRNLAYCFMEDGVVKYLDKADIFEGRDIVVKETFDCTIKFMESIQDLVDSADVVLVEKQFVDNKLALSTSLLVIQTVIQTLCRTKCVVVHALAIKRIYGTSTGEYRSNKQAAIKKALEIFPEITSMFPKKKIDDISDAFLLTHFGSFHLSTFFSNNRCRYINGFDSDNATYQQRRRGKRGREESSSPRNSSSGTPPKTGEGGQKEERECGT